MGWGDIVGYTVQSQTDFLKVLGISERALIEVEEGRERERERERW